MSAWVQTFLNSESVQTFLTQAQIKNVKTFSRGADIFYVKDGNIKSIVQTILIGVVYSISALVCSSRMPIPLDDILKDLKIVK